MTNPPIQALPRVMTTDQVADVPRCSPASAAAYVFTLRLAATQIARNRRFRALGVPDFIAWRLASNRSKTRQPRALRAN